MKGAGTISLPDLMRSWGFDLSEAAHNNPHHSDKIYNDSNTQEIMSNSLYFVLPIVDKQTHGELTADIGRGISELWVNTDAWTSFIVSAIIPLLWTAYWVSANKGSSSLARNCWVLIFAETRTSLLVFTAWRKRSWSQTPPSKYEYLGLEDFSSDSDFLLSLHSRRCHLAVRK